MIFSLLNYYRFFSYSIMMYCKNSIHTKIRSIIKNKGILNIFDIFKYFNRVLKNLNTSNTIDNSIGEFSNKTPPLIIIISLLIILSIWAVSGFYTIKEAERGVILRFGQYHHLVQPGLNWKPTFIDFVIPINVESVRELAASGMMLTSDENVVRVEMNVQYRVTNPKNYLFSVTDADDSLRQATDSALRGVIGKYNMDRILTEGRTVVRSDTRRILEKTIQPYNMGISLLDVNFQTARPPEEVKAAFDDAIAARENEQQYIREAEAYANEIQPKANGQAQRILEEGRAYKARTILEAQGEVQRFLKILPEYKAAPEITRKRLYINSMERIFSKTRKVLLDASNVQNILLFSADPMNSVPMNKGTGRYYENDIKKKVDKNINTMKKNHPININSNENNFQFDSVYNLLSDKKKINFFEEILDQGTLSKKSADIIKEGRLGGEL